MHLLGIGTISSAGCGIEALEKALVDGWQPPGELEAAVKEGGKRRFHQVEFDSVPDKSLLKKLRRADKLSKMSVLAAAGAICDGGIDAMETGRVGIILATAFGPHVTTFDFLDGILEFGEASASPTAFSNSVHNAAASYVSSALDIKGPTLTVSRFRFSFHSALQLAKGWLDQGRCDYLLVGAVEQYGDVLGHVSERILGSAADGVISPFSFNPTAHFAGEGAVFFLLGREKGENSYCSVEGVETWDPAVETTPADLQVLAADGMLKDESILLSAIDRDTPVAAYAPLYGSTMGGSAFAVAISALMLKKQMVYAAPERTNPHALHLVTATEAAPLHRIRCYDCNCQGEVATVSLLSG